MLSLQTWFRSCSAVCVLISLYLETFSWFFCALAWAALSIRSRRWALRVGLWGHFCLSHRILSDSHLPVTSASFGLQTYWNPGLEGTGDTSSWLWAGFGFPMDASVVWRYVELSPALCGAVPALALSGSCDFLWSLWEPLFLGSEASIASTRKDLTSVLEVGNSDDHWDGGTTLPSIIFLEVVAGGQQRGRAGHTSTLSCLLVLEHGLVFCLFNNLQWIPQVLVLPPFNSCVVLPFIEPFENCKAVSRLEEDNRNVERGTAAPKGRC